MTQSSCKRDTKSKSHPGMRLAQLYLNDNNIFWGETGNIFFLGGGGGASFYPSSTLERTLVTLKNYPASKVSGALWRRGGKRKESLQLRLWTLNICIGKVDTKYWLGEMTLVMTSLLLARAFQCCLHSRWLAEIWQLSQRGNWGWNSNSRDVVASSPSFSRPAARASQRACSQAIEKLCDKNKKNCPEQKLNLLLQTRASSQANFVI